MLEAIIVYSWQDEVSPGFWLNWWAGSCLTWSLHIFVSAKPVLFHCLTYRSVHSQSAQVTAPPPSLLCWALLTQVRFSPPPPVPDHTPAPGRHPSWWICALQSMCPAQCPWQDDCSGGWQSCVAPWPAPGSQPVSPGTVAGASSSHPHRSQHCMELSHYSERGGWVREMLQWNPGRSPAPPPHSAGRRT